MTLQKHRDNIILEIEKTENKSSYIEERADDLLNLGLTMYSRNYSLESLIYNSFAASVLDEQISLHPEQLNVIEELNCNEGVIFSAPTSFGKTFVVFEYIARAKPKNIVLIVPTLALVDEYNKKIIKKYSSFFKEYSVYLTINEDYKYDFEKNNLFILTHDRVLDIKNTNVLKEIDFLVIDEVYKLQKNELDDRVLTLNLAYYYLVKIAKKHLLLAPFIGGIENVDALEKSPKFVKSDYSPVVNKVQTYNVLNKSERDKKVIDIVKSLAEDDKTMVYFPTVTNIYSFISNNMDKFESKPLLDDSVINFIKWIKDEIHEDWYLVKALEKGILVHNGQIPLGIRMFLLNLYNEEESYNILLCTSTLLEGVNTSAKHIVITKPSRGGNKDTHLRFDAFDFYNLVGRSGRLFEHFLGIAHYIKAPEDPIFNKEEAVKTIEFEISGETEDINIHTDNILNEEEYKKFLSLLGISHEDYKLNIGAKFRFKTIQRLYDSYQKNKSDLLKELYAHYENNQRGRLNLVKVLYRIFEGKNQPLYSNIINQLLHKNRLQIKNIVNNTLKYFKKTGIDNIISTTLRLKSSYIEYEFYTKLVVLIYFMRCDKTDANLISILELKVKDNIEYLYFSESTAKRMLKDIGIYERDIEKIIRVIGSNFKDTFELRELLLNNKTKFKNLSYLSLFIINSI